MIKVGIIGTGSFASAHLNAYLGQKERCRVNVLYNRTIEKAEKFARDNRLDGVQICRDPEEFTEAAPDLVSVCTPPSAHADAAVMCLENKINVLLEKPMADSLQECDRILKAAEKSAALLSVVAQNRFTEANWKLKKMLESGYAGKLNYINVNSSWWRGLHYYDKYWRGTWETEGGGCTLNHAVHTIDLMLWYAGMPEKVKAFLANTSHPNSNTEDVAAAVLSWKSGALGQLLGSVIHHGEKKEIIVQCEKGMLASPWETAVSADRGDGFPVIDKEAEKMMNEYYSSIPGPEYSGLDGQINDVISAIETKTQPLVSGQDGKNAIELVTAIYASHFLDRTETLPLKADHPFYTKEGMMKNVRNFNNKK